MIHVIGSGVRSPEQMTIESLMVLKRSRKTLIIPDSGQQMLRFIKEHGLPAAENIRHLYVNGRRDIENYKAIVEKVIKEFDGHGSICLVVAGHPLFGVSLIKMISKAVGRENIRIYEGISSLCTMVSDLEIDPIAEGCMMLDVNRALLNDWSLNNRVHNFLYHVCSVATPNTWYRDPSRENQFIGLKDYLLRFYSPEHSVNLLSSGRDSEASVQILGNIGQIETLLPHVNFSTTMHIPPQKSSSGEQVNLVFMRDYISNRQQIDFSQEQILAMCQKLADKL